MTKQPTLMNFTQLKRSANSVLSPTMGCVKCGGGQGVLCSVAMNEYTDNKAFTRPVASMQRLKAITLHYMDRCCLTVFTHLVFHYFYMGEEEKEEEEVRSRGKGKKGAAVHQAGRMSAHLFRF